MFDKKLPQWLVIMIGILAPSYSQAQDLQAYMDKYFKGAAIRFGYGSGTSSNNPRVSLVVRYCASGFYGSSGQSCRPNIIARGHQCTPIRDAGRWQIRAQGRQATLYWRSNSTKRPSSLPLRVRADGVIVDTRGNAFVRVGRAGC